MAHQILKIVVDPADFDYVSASVVSDLDGNLAVVSFAGGDVTFTARGDGANVLVEGLRLLADKVEAAHTEWLRAKKGEPPVPDVLCEDGQCGTCWGCRRYAEENAQ